MGILGRTAAALAATLITSVSLGATAATASDPDPYSAKIATETKVSTPSPIRTKTKVAITIDVTANSPTSPTGTVEVTLHSAPGGAGQARSAAADLDGWTRTIRYDGSTARLTGPAFSETGDWLVTAEFTPGDSQFRGSRGATTFEVITSDGGDGSDDGDDNGGLLPDAGGPGLVWLVLGLGLVGIGIAGVLAVRRRRAPTAA